MSHSWFLSIDYYYLLRKLFLLSIILLHLIIFYCSCLTLIEMAVEVVQNPVVSEKSCVILTAIIAGSWTNIAHSEITLNSLRYLNILQLIVLVWCPATVLF